MPLALLRRTLVAGCLLAAGPLAAQSWPIPEWNSQPSAVTPALQALEAYAFPARDDATRAGVRSDALLVIKDGQVDEPLGFVHKKELLKELLEQREPDIEGLLRRPLIGNMWIMMGGALVNVAIASGIGAIGAGWTDGLEYLEMPWQIGIFFAAGMVCIIGPVMYTLVNRKVESLYVTTWYHTAGLLWIGYLHRQRRITWRKDLADKAGVQVPERPTWPQIKDLAAKMHDPKNGVYGICLRGKPGWGDNMAFITTLVNTFGGQWFDMQWKPQLESKPWKDAITFYVDLLKNYGPPGSSSNSFNEILALTNSGKCGMWIDATIAASFVSDPKQSKVADQMAFAQAPIMNTPKGANWLWSWNLAIPAGSKKVDAAQKFITWSTSKDYIQLVAKTNGWANVPTGTRKSTYASPEFQKAARFAAAEKTAIDSANPNDSTLPKSPYVGVQFAAIPEFQAIGIAVGQQMSAALAGKTTVDAALKASQVTAEREMKKGGYYK